MIGGPWSTLNSALCRCGLVGDESMKCPSKTNVAIRHKWLYTCTVPGHKQQQQCRASCVSGVSSRTGLALW
ncbi:hypothetical protein E2C01_093327 [Portunus trituberculatus]|uniref:Uncharacterized protein n=1 Tax=Portunus trituberculatus TaxID=210409 RepID=A0A5B7JMG1_PORTR|nr:hypothetical protein [Portunus trituberculatus]